jgi:hypothetical protein
MMPPVPGLPTSTPITPAAQMKPGAAASGQPTATNPTGTPLPGVAGPTTQTSAGTVPGSSTGSTQQGQFQAMTAPSTSAPGPTAVMPGTTPTAVATPAPASVPTAAPAAEQYTGQPLQAVTGNPSGNLVGTQINAATSPLTNQLTGQESQAATTLANQGNPDLTGATNAAFQSWVNENNPVYQQALREATDQAAATGSLGSGQLETGLGSLADTFAQQAMAAETGGQLSALETQAQNANQAAGTLAELQGGSYGENTSATNQLDQQQQNQEALQQQAVTNAANQAQEQQSIDNSQVGNALNEYDAGLASSPVNTEVGLGNTYGAEASNTAANTGSLLSGANYQNALNGLATASTPSINFGAPQYQLPTATGTPILPVTNDPYSDTLPLAPDPSQYLDLSSLS